MPFFTDKGWLYLFFLSNWQQAHGMLTEIQLISDGNPTLFNITT
jgi:hypothetical protein